MPKRREYAMMEVSSQPLMSFREGLPDLTGPGVAEYGQTRREKKAMGIVISEDILYATHMTEAEFLQEIAVSLYQKGKLSLGKASQLAGMGRIQFQMLLASRQIPINYGIEDFEADLNTLRRLGQL
ncbi:MAG: hypothetical protein BroJett021_52170 [Chloroflexota bacterium]|nr:MAG: hypothetical protein BroJett021_52170 [Chloroflexota bacterium]